MKLASKRVYDEPDKSDGIRVLVDRLWPRGISKANAHIDDWAKEIAPSNELRRWFHRDRVKHWQEFFVRYQDELEHNDAVKVFLGKYRRKSLTLITAARDIEHSHLPVLRNFLQSRLKR